MAEETTRLWRIRHTALEMLHDRGYLVPKTELEMSLEEFKKQFGDPPQRDGLILAAPKKDDPTDQILVFFSGDAKVGVKELKEYVNHMEAERIKRGILILKDKITPMARQALQTVAQSGTVLEEFQESHLIVNITKHVLVPEHIVLTPEEKANLLKRYKLEESQLPRMLESDPIARYYGLGRGQVTKIIRPSETAGKYVTYRLVV